VAVAGPPCCVRIALLNGRQNTGDFTHDRSAYPLTLLPSITSLREGAEGGRGNGTDWREAVPLATIAPFRPKFKEVQGWLTNSKLASGFLTRPRG
jgi:hypothetical protein